MPPASKLERPRSSSGLTRVLLGLGALLVGCARGRRAPPTTEPPQRTSAGADAGARVAREADAAVGLCAATLAQAARLLPSVDAEGGVELASGTSLQVLGLAVDAEGAPRQRGVGTVFRVRAGAAEGYATLGPTELSSACPVVFPEALLPPAPATEEELARHHGADREHALRAAYRAEVGPDGVPLRPPAIHPVTRADVDGDGVLDEVVRIDTALGARSALQLVLLQGAHGVAAFRVGAAERSDGSDDLEEDCGEPLAVSGAFYLVRTRRERVGEAPQPVVARTRYTLLRCRRGGPCVSVGSAFTTFGGAERWTFEEGEQGGLRVRSSLGRAQTLRWDEASFRLRL